MFMNNITDDMTVCSGVEPRTFPCGCGAGCQILGRQVYSYLTPCYMVHVGSRNAVCCHLVTYTTVSACCWSCVEATSSCLVMFAHESQASSGYGDVSQSSQYVTHTSQNVTHTSQDVFRATSAGSDVSDYNVVALTSQDAPLDVLQTSHELRDVSQTSLDVTRMSQDVLLISYEYRDISQILDVSQTSP